MAYIVGTDEAGYGPNLGPLVVTATLWEVPDDVEEDELYDRLAHVIVPTLRQAAESNGRCLAMADSKRLHQSGGGVKHLERGVLSALGLLGYDCDLWSEVWDAFVPNSLAELAHIPWYAQYNETVPIHAKIDGMAAVLADGLASAGIRLHAIASDAVFPKRFNELLLLHESKGTALSHVSLNLASHVIGSLDSGPIAVVCDKHGGRNRYGRLLEEYFPDWRIECCEEGRDRSEYAFGPAERRIRTCFRTRAEACLPVALASMVSKYLRELAMRALNAFWRRRVPGLKPTAGYPVDAVRFRRDIAETQAALGIDDNVLWRNR